MHKSLLSIGSWFALCAMCPIALKIRPAADDGLFRHRAEERIAKKLSPQCALRQLIFCLSVVIRPMIRMRPLVHAGRCRLRQFPLSDPRRTEWIQYCGTISLSGVTLPACGMTTTRSARSVANWIDSPPPLFTKIRVPNSPARSAAPCNCSTCCALAD